MTAPHQLDKQPAGVPPAGERPAALRGGRAQKWGRALRAAAGGAFLLYALDLHFTGQLVGLLMQAALFLPLAAIGVRIWAASRKSLAWDWLRHPARQAHRGYLLQFVNRALFWTLAAAAIHVSVPAAVFAREEYAAVRGTLVGAAVLLALLEAAPPRRIYRVPNLVFALGSLYLGMQLMQIYSPRTPSGLDGVALDAPFRGEWNVFHGGRSGLINHHWEIPEQRHALDLDRALSGPPADAEAGKLQSYAAFGEPLHSPAFGRVAEAVDRYPDNPIGQTDAQHLTGNYVVIEMGRDRYVLLAHLMRGSVRVRKGERVRRGQLVARCGNSGNTSEPHLHLQVQDKPEFAAPGLRTFPILFRGVTLVREGRSTETPLSEVRRNDRIIPRDPPRQGASPSPG